MALTGLGMLVPRRRGHSAGGSGRLMGLYVLAYCGTVCLTPWPPQWRRYWFPWHPAGAGLVPVSALGRARAVVLTGSGPGSTQWLGCCRPWSSPACSSWSCSPYFTHIARSRGDAVLHDQRGSPVRFSLFFYGQPDRERDAALEWLHGRGRPGDVVASAMPHWAHLLTGMKTVVPPFERDPARAEAL